MLHWDCHSNIDYMNVIIQVTTDRSSSNTILIATKGYWEQNGDKNMNDSTAYAVQKNDMPRS